MRGPARGASWLPLSGLQLCSCIRESIHFQLSVSLTDRCRTVLPLWKLSWQPSVTPHRRSQWEDVSSSASRSFILRSESTKCSLFPPHSSADKRRFLPAATQSILLRRSTAVNLSDRRPYMGTPQKAEGQRLCYPQAEITGGGAAVSTSPNPSLGKQRIVPLYIHLIANMQRKYLYQLQTQNNVFLNLHPDGAAFCLVACISMTDDVLCPGCRLKLGCRVDTCGPHR